MRLLIGAVIAILVLVFGSVGYVKHVNARKARAVDALAEAHILRKNDKIEEAITQCRSVLEEFKGTKSAGEALVMLGDLYFATSAYEDARAVFRRCLDVHDGDETMVYACVEGIAATLEQEEKYEEAAVERRSFAEKHRESPFAPRALFEAARCFELAQRPDEARTALQKLVDAYPEAQLARKAKTRMELLPQAS